ncbi:hypothetical protein ABPG74_000766 [Tetrahymena malaccensis]
MIENLQIKKIDCSLDKRSFLKENTFTHLKIAFSKFSQVDLYFRKVGSYFSFHAYDQYGNQLQVNQRVQQFVIQMLKQYQIKGNCKQKNLEKQLSEILGLEKDKGILCFKKCFLQGGGNLLSNNYEELKQQKQQYIIECLEQKEDEDSYKSCIYVKECIQELKEMIKHLTELRSNTKTYSYQKFKNLNQAFFENPECHPLLLAFLELSTDRLLFFMNQDKLNVTENQKNEFVKLIDDQIQILQSFQQKEPLQNHIFYFKLIKYIFLTSKSIETTSQMVVKSGQTLLQVFTVAYKQDRQALKQLIDKCKNACSAYRNCNKLGGIIKYNELILSRLEESLPINSLSTQSSFSSQDYSRKSTSASLQSENMQNNFDQVKQQNAVQYELELQIRHESINTNSHFRVQYYALMQIDKLIQQMKEDPGYQVNQNSTYFLKFIKNNDNGIFSYSERQYFFRQLENLAFERNILLRYISLSILIRCYELFMQKCPNYPLLQEIIDAIYYRYYFEVHQKIYILITKNKDLLLQIKNKDSIEKQKELKNIANQASQIIQQQNSQIKNYDEQYDFDQQSMSQQSQQEDIDMMISRIDQIKNTQDSYLQSRIAWQNYINQQYNMLSTLKITYVDLFSIFNNQKSIQKTLLDDYFIVKQVSSKRAIIVQGEQGSGKTSLAQNIHQILIEQNKNQIDWMFTQSKQSQSCMPVFGQKTIIYTPILLKLQNMNLTNKDDLQNLFDSQLSEIMQNFEYKVIIIDGLNDQNQYNLSQILKNQIKDKKKVIFLITSTSQNQQFFFYNGCVMQFLNSLDIKTPELEFDGIQIEKLLSQQQIKQFLDIQNINREKQFNNQTKYNLKGQQNLLNQNVDQKLNEAILRSQDPLLMQNPQYLYQIYIIQKQFQSMGSLQKLSQTDINKMFFVAQFYGQFSYFQKIQKQQQSIVKIFEMAYFQLFVKIVEHMQMKKQNFIALEIVQNDILNEISKQLNRHEQKFYQNQLKNEKEQFLELKEYFISHLTKYYNKQIFEKLNSLSPIVKENTESITFKQESYFNYFLSYKQE